MRHVRNFLHRVVFHAELTLAGKEDLSQEYIQSLNFGWLLLIFLGPFFYAYAIHFLIDRSTVAFGLMLFGAISITIMIFLYIIPSTRKIGVHGFRMIILIGVFVPLILVNIDVIWLQARLEYVPWLFLLPPLVFSLLGEKGGIHLICLLGVIGILGLIFPLRGHGRAFDLQSFKLQCMLAISCCCLVAIALERTRRQTLGRLIDSEKHLRKTILDLIEAEGEARRNLRQAERASRAKSEFLANMSHELRTPLNHVIGFTELVLDDAGPELSTNNRESLGDVLNSARHLLSLINDTLDMSRIEAGKIELACTEVELAPLLQKSLNIVKDSALRKEIGLFAELDDIPARVWVDERKLTQVLYNLLSNAVKYTPHGGRVVVTAHTCTPDTPGDDGRSAVEISVSDTGIGLRADECAKLFVPFQRIENPSNRNTPGTGLGLSLARKLVELHGGRIWAESSGEQKGTTFRFTIPLGSRENGCR
jgi:signal transduction histidine kinase